MIKPSLKLRFCGKPVVRHSLLAVRTLLPVLHIHLVASDMYILEGEESEHFRPDIAAELQHLVLSRTHRRGEESAPPRLIEARESVITLDGSEAMTRHIYLRHHIYASLGSIRHDVSHVVLRIEAAILLRSVRSCPNLRLRQQQVGHILLSGISHTERPDC